MARDTDDYKNIDFYTRNSEAVENGFASFEADGAHYFCRYVDGDIALISQAYQGRSGRDNGIRSVQKNAPMAERYKFDTRSGGRHGFSLLAGNRQEIAISPGYASEAEARRVSERMQATSDGAPAKKAAKKAPAKSAAPKRRAPAKPREIGAASATGAAFTSGDGRRGNYKPLDFYTDHGGNTQDGFDSFTHDGAHYFSYRKDGRIHLISEAYTAEKGRDNGIASVKKNLPNAARYKHRTHSNGKHYFDLVAGNNQEIATSVWYDSDKASKDAAASLRAKPKPKPKPKPKAKAATAAVAATAAAAAAPKRKANVEQNYRDVDFYRKASTGKPKNGIERIQDGDEFFFVYNEDGKVALISESYPTANARDIGAASVEKNIKLENRYNFKEGGAEGKAGFRLRAGNNKEIARSVGYGSAAAATAGAAYLLGTRKRAAAAPKPAPKPKPPVAAAAVAAAAVGGAAMAAKRDPNRDKTDDYLPCEAYQGHPVTDPVNRVALFQHDNGQHYFVFYDVDGDVRWRSEGFPTEAARQEELDIALRLHENGEYIKRMERGDRYIDMLHDETGREVARSCLCTVAPVVAAPVAAAPVAAAAAAAPAAVIAEGGGVWGWLKWLLLLLAALLALFFLFRACSGTPDVPEVVAPAAAPAAMVTCWDGSEAATQAACPARITCDDGSVVTDRANCPAPAPTMVTCWDGSEAESRSDCPVRPTVTCPDGSTAFTRAECPAPVRTTTAAPARAAVAGSLGFFNTDACNGNFKTVSRLGTNPEYGDSHSLTPSGFYDKLAREHAMGGVDRTHLNALARALGYANFGDMDASQFSNATIASGTRGILGYGDNHGLQCSNLLPSASRDLEAFAIQGANGRTVYFMKTCGNYFYPA